MEKLNKKKFWECIKKIQQIHEAVVVFYQKDKVVCILTSVKFGYCYLVDPAARLNKNNKQSYFGI